jgi:putative hydrolase of the HAD superfamily
VKQAKGARLRIVFDFAGVLFQWQPLDLLKRELPLRATDAASVQRLALDIFQAYGGDWAEFDRGTLGVPELVRRIAARTGLPPQDVQTVVDAVPAELQPVPETVALLQRLHAQGRRLHYLSNMPHPYADHLEREHAFLRCFESGVISARVGLIKPEPAIYRHAAQRFQADPAELLFLDDVFDNVLAARQAGWQAVHFVDAAEAEAQMRAIGWL